MRCDLAGVEKIRCKGDRRRWVVLPDGNPRVVLECYVCQAHYERAPLSVVVEASRGARLPGTSTEQEITPLRPLEERQKAYGLESP